MKWNEEKDGLLIKEYFHLYRGKHQVEVSKEGYFGKKFLMF